MWLHKLLVIKDGQRLEVSTLGHASSQSQSACHELLSSWEIHVDW
jgi:hypothetical protein